MTIQKMASFVRTVFALVPASRTAATYTSAAYAPATYGYPQTARAVVGATIDGGGTVDAYLTANGSGSHVKVTGSDITQIIATGSQVGPEVEIDAKSTEVKLVIVLAVATEEVGGLIEFGQGSYGA